MSGDDKDSWKDTNVGLIGSDLDKQVRKDAAGHEPAWADSGKKAGLMIWRIEHFQVVAVEESSYGQFHKGDSYICLQTIEDPDSGKLTHNIFFYLGVETSIDERGTAAYKTVELDDFFDGEPIQHREVMNEETDAFKALFPSGITQLDGGMDSGFKHVVPEGHDPKMWQVRKHKGELKVMQIPLETRCLNSGDCFVLSTDKAIYVLDAPECKAEEKLFANQKAEEVEGTRDGKANATHDIDDDFWAALKGPKPKWFTDKPKDKPLLEEPDGKGGYKAPEPEAAPAAPVFETGPKGFFTLESLQGGCPDGVDPGSKEQSLRDDIFKEVFGKTKEEFAALPKWKQQAQKKDKNLF